MAFFIDRNDDRRCNDGDLGATVRLDGRQEIVGGALLEGAALAEIVLAAKADLRARMAAATEPGDQRALDAYYEMVFGVDEDEDPED